MLRPPVSKPVGSCRSLFRFVRGLAAASFLLASPKAFADAPAPTRRPSPIAFVVSGGVSLGAYEAGFLYALVETLKHHRDVFDVRIATGASAGSTNGFLSLLESCEPPNGDPTKSLLFKAWKDVGFPRLFDPKDTTPIAAFSRKPLDALAKQIEERFDEGLPASCDVMLGVSTTRLAAQQHALGPESPLRLPRTEEKFVVHMLGKGAGKPPALENYVDPKYGFPQALLPLPSGPKAFEALRDLLYASGAYPFAFAPVPLAHCMTDPEHPSAACTEQLAQRALFIDGGVFDNQPLGLAARLVGDGFAADSGSGERASFEKPARRRNAKPASDTLFMYVDPHLHSYPEPPATPEARDTYSARRLALHYLDTFISSALSKELTSVLEAAPELREKLVLSVADVPPIGETLANFFGLFDENLRSFDFYLGMRGARRFVDGPLREAMVRRRGFMPEIADDDEGEGKHLEPYRCLRAVLDRKGSSVERCKPVSREFRAVLQTSIAKLYDRCARVREAGPRGEEIHRSCAPLRGEPPRIPEVPARPPGFFRQRDGEAELSYVVRLLSGYGFTFKDLELDDPSDNENPAHVEQAIHRQLRLILQAFGAAQPESRILVDAVARTMLGQLRYVPPAAILHVGLGSVIEGGASFRLGSGPTRFLRATASFNAGGLTSFSGDGGAYFTLAPMLGFEGELLPLSSANLQPRVGIRGGYLFSTVDRFLLGDCKAPDKGVCSRATAQVYAAVSLFERFRLQAAFAMLPALRPGEGFSWSILPTGGIQFLWP